MQQKQSILWNQIFWDESTLERDIVDILTARFWEWEILEWSLDDLYDPYLLAGMREAVIRIKQAKDTNERVMIFWDYDVDGVTSTSILMHFFKKIWLSVSYRLPHRVKDGYGLKQHFIDESKRLGVTLLITVDCGTRDVEIIRYAKSIGIDVIVTDHHAVPDIIPEEAVALINPKRRDCPYPFKHLSWAGVAYKLMMALAREYLSEDEYKPYLQESIDIAAIWTVADCMSLTGENRVIVQEGLKQLRYTRSRWLRHMIEEKIATDLDADIFGFLIGPRLNAAGRMDTPYKAVNLILNQEDSVMDTLIDIENLNDKRRKLTHKFVAEALESIDTSHNIIFYNSPHIEHGIIGIVAGRLTEQFYKPSIVLIDEGDKLVASCRSPDYFDIVEILTRHAHFFERFWGHKQAAGFTILKEKFADFQTAIYEDIDSFDFSQKQKTIRVDKLISPQEIGFRLLETMNQFKPFWLGNPKPLLMFRDFDVTSVNYMGKGVDHIRFDTLYGYKIVGFGFGKYLDEIKKQESISIIFDLSEDSYNGRKGLMLKIVDIIFD
jgi:single-stranded-DNA-specific exonuclease